MSAKKRTSSNIRAMIRARMEATGEKYLPAKQAVERDLKNGVELPLIGFQAGGVPMPEGIGTLVSQEWDREKSVLVTVLNGVYFDFGQDITLHTWKDEGGLTSVALLSLGDDGDYESKDLDELFDKKLAKKTEGWLNSQHDRKAPVVIDEYYPVTASAAHKDFDYGEFVRSCFPNAGARTQEIETAIIRIASGINGNTVGGHTALTALQIAKAIGTEQGEKFLEGSYPEHSEDWFVLDRIQKLPQAQRESEMAVTINQLGVLAEDMTSNWISADVKNRLSELLQLGRSTSAQVSPEALVAIWLKPNEGDNVSGDALDTGEVARRVVEGLRSARFRIPGTVLNVTFATRSTETEAFTRAKNVVYDILEIATDEAFIDPEDYDAISHADSIVEALAAGGVQFDDPKFVPFPPILQRMSDFGEVSPLPHTLISGAAGGRKEVVMEQTPHQIIMSGSLGSAKAHLVPFLPLIYHGNGRVDEAAGREYDLVVTDHPERFPLGRKFTNDYADIDSVEAGSSVLIDDADLNISRLSALTHVVGMLTRGSIRATILVKNLPAVPDAIRSAAKVIHLQKNGVVVSGTGVPRLIEPDVTLPIFEGDQRMELGVGESVLIAGVSGSGKTVLIEEMTKSLREAGEEVWAIERFNTVTADRTFPMEDFSGLLAAVSEEYEMRAGELRENGGVSRPLNVVIDALEYMMDDDSRKESMRKLSALLRTVRHTGIRFIVSMNLPSVNIIPRGTSLSFPHRLLVGKSPYQVGVMVFGHVDEIQGIEVERGQAIYQDASETISLVTIVRT